MRGRKSLISDRDKYASILAKLEAGKSSVKIGDMRQVMKLLVTLEATLIKAGYKSGLMVLRREAREVAAKLDGKKYGRAKTLITK